MKLHLSKLNLVKLCSAEEN